MKLLVKINLIGLSFIIIGFVIKTAHSLLFAQFTLMQVCLLTFPKLQTIPIKNIPCPLSISASHIIHNFPFSLPGSLLRILARSVQRSTS